MFFFFISDFQVCKLYCPRCLLSPPTYSLPSSYLLRPPPPVSSRLLVLSHLPLAPSSRHTPAVRTTPPAIHSPAPSLFQRPQCSPSPPLPSLCPSIPQPRRMFFFIFISR
ncbi:hypothetical protein E2C01_069736 [Portunus trituberculatus]|uniref:Uncharacterized protein n=1 Tax=Portunus trituberculatus TaxID=210409 RepID=A0A5B7HSC3_PORTR|nr:hypothetical protein [Portunus trituberculatus]